MQICSNIQASDSHELDYPKMQFCLLFEKKFCVIKIYSIKVSRWFMKVVFSEEEWCKLLNNTNSSTGPSLCTRLLFLFLPRTDVGLPLLPSFLFGKLVPLNLQRNFAQAIPPVRSSVVVSATGSWTPRLSFLLPA